MFQKALPTSGIWTLCSVSGIKMRVSILSSLAHAICITIPAFGLAGSVHLWCEDSCRKSIFSS